MNKICPRCRKVYSYNDRTCPNGCSDKRKKESNKVYDKEQRTNKDLYNSREWKLLREACKKRFSGLCIWSLYAHERIVHGTLTHHIEPVEDSEDKALNPDNLIYLSDTAHREIHELYNNDKEVTQALLLEYIKLWDETDEGVGL